MLNVERLEPVLCKAGALCRWSLTARNQRSKPSPRGETDLLAVTAPKARRLGIAKSYDDLHKILRERADELQVPREGLAEAAKLSDRYVAKLLAPIPIRHLGPNSLGPLLAALGLKLIVVEDVETLERIAKRITRRQLKVNNAGCAKQAQARRKSQRFRPFRDSPDFARMARAQQLLRQSREQRSKIARQAAKARWSVAVRGA
jgi:hypothetical protein